jgi:hypothetical protein
MKLRCPFLDKEEFDDKFELEAHLLSHQHEQLANILNEIIFRIENGRTLKEILEF